MLNPSNSNSWHLKLITFAGYRENVDLFSYVGTLNTCEYYAYVLKSILKIVWFSSLTFLLFLSITMHIIFTVILFESSNTFLGALKDASTFLSLHFYEQFGVFGAVFAAFPLSALTILIAVILSVMLWCVVIFTIKAKDFAVKFVMSKDFTIKGTSWKKSSTYAVLHSKINKYCVPVKTHYSE